MPELKVSPKQTVGMGDHVELTLTTEEDKVTKKRSDVSSESLAKMKFCPDCGSPLREITLYECDGCGDRYATDEEPKTHNIVMISLGKKKAL